MSARQIAVAFALAGATLFAEPSHADTRAPARLSIPSLGLFDAPVVALPIQGGRWAEERLGAREVGLLETTGRWPGDTWAMVLAGHVTLEGDQRGPFYGLGSLRPGQILLLYGHDGQPWRYRVVGQRLLTADAVKAIYRRDSRRLLLMTCAVWDDAQHDYTHRLVIEAVLEAPTGTRNLTHVLQAPRM
jgi:hypothetical protein